MKKLSLSKKGFSHSEVLSRSQLKNIIGGLEPGGSGNWFACHCNCIASSGPVDFNLPRGSYTNAYIASNSIEAYARCRVVCPDIIITPGDDLKGVSCVEAGTA